MRAFKFSRPTYEGKDIEGVLFSGGLVAVHYPGKNLDRVETFAGIESAKIYYDREIVWLDEQARNPS